MRTEGKSFASFPVLATIVVATLGFGTTSAMGWPWWLRSTTAALAVLLVAMAAYRNELATWAWRVPLVGEWLEHFVSSEHSPARQRTWMSVALVGAGCSFFWLVLGGSQWALALFCLCLGGLAFYWGTKVCHLDHAPRRAEASVAIGGYFLSLSANFIAGAAAGQTSLEASLVSLHAKADLGLAMLSGIKEDTSAIKGDTSTIKDDTSQIKGELAAQGTTLGRVEAYLDHLKFLGVDPTKGQPPPDVIAAAKELMESRDGRQRAQAAIVLKRWDEWGREVAALHASRATEDVFQNKSLEGDGYYAQGKFDEAIAPYEVAFRLRESDVVARNNVAIALTSARRGNAADCQRRAIEVYGGTLKLPDISRGEWAMTQNNLGSAWSNMLAGNKTQNLARAIAAFEAALTVRTRDAFPFEWAMTQNNLGNAWQDMPTGNKAENLAKAITAFEAALTVRTRDAFPFEWAMTQNNLGNSWQTLPTGDKAENQNKAIAAYEAALTVLTREATAFHWATTQSNLGSAWWSLPKGDRSENLRKAIAAFDAALTVLTREASPFDWAKTQNNLGNAWQNMPKGDMAENLGKAIAAFEAALTVFTFETSPFDWATTQNNLGTAWQEMPTGDKTENVGKAIAAFGAALTVHAREASPFDWAKLQNNIGNSWRNIPTGDKAENLGKAIAAFEAALTVLTREAAPFDWAATQNNLGNAWQEMPTGDKVKNLENAIAAFEAALTVRTRAASPFGWAMTQNNLGNAWAKMSTGDKMENLERAIAAYDAALTVRSHEASPFGWAMTQSNLAVAFADQAEVPGATQSERCERLRRAITLRKSVLSVYTLDAMPREHAATLINLSTHRSRFETLGCHVGPNGVPFDDIPIER